MLGVFLLLCENDAPGEFRHVCYQIMVFSAIFGLSPPPPPSKDGDQSRFTRKAVSNLGVLFATPTLEFDMGWDPWNQLPAKVFLEVAVEMMKNSCM